MPKACKDATASLSHYTWQTKRQFHGRQLLRGGSNSDWKPIAAAMKEGSE